MHFSFTVKSAKKHKLQATCKSFRLQFSSLFTFMYTSSDKLSLKISQAKLRNASHPMGSFSHQYRNGRQLPRYSGATHYNSKFYNKGSPYSELIYVIQSRMWDVCACGMRQNAHWYLIPIPFASLRKHVACCSVLIPHLA